MAYWKAIDNAIQYWDDTLKKQHLKAAADEWELQNKGAFATIATTRIWEKRGKI